MFIIVSSTAPAAAGASATAARHPATRHRAAARPHAGRPAAAARARLGSVESPSAAAKCAAVARAATPQVTGADVIPAAEASAVTAQAPAVTAHASAIAERGRPGAVADGAAGPIAETPRARAITQAGGAHRSAAADRAALTLHLLPCACLPLRQRVSTCSAPVPAGSGAVAIGRAAAVLGSMLPVTAPTDVRVSCADIRVPVEVVVVVDRQVVVAPSGSPAPAAVPPERTHGHTD